MTSATRSARRAWLHRTLATILALSPTVAAAQDGPMTFEVAHDQATVMAELMLEGGVRTIWATGEITPGTTERFLNFIRANKIDAAKVELNSPGGSLAEGMKFGRLLRSMQFFTAVGDRTDKYPTSSAICASACAYTFAGGVSRFLLEGSGRLGIHQFYSDGQVATSEGDAQIVSGVIVAYFNAMDVDARAFTLSTAADRNGMIWLTPEIAEELGFANNGKQPTTAELKMAEMRPYLRLNQEQFDVTTRVLFICIDRQMEMQGGIVTNPENSKMHTAYVKRAYVELDGTETLVMTGQAAVSAADSTVWLRRKIPPSMAVNLMRTNRLDLWLEGNGAFRWGGSMDLRNVKKEMANYFKQCFQ